MCVILSSNSQEKEEKTDKANEGTSEDRFIGTFISVTENL